MFFSSLKLQYCRTIVLVNKLLKLFKTPFFFKIDGGHAISPQEKRRLPKSTARFPAKKKWHSPPHPSGCLGTPLPLPRVCTGVRACTDVTNKISRIFRLPNLLSNGSPLASPAGSAIKQAVRHLISNLSML